jgi:Flp pilus assembly protein TadD
MKMTTAPASLRLGIAAVLIFGALSACGGRVPSAEERAAEDQNARVNQMMRVAEVTEQGGDIASAMSLYERAHMMDPTNPAPLIALGRTNRMVGRHRVAAESFRKAIAADEKNIDARLGYGRELIALDRLEPAVAEFQKATKMAPNDVRGYNGLGVAYDLSGDHDAAEKTYREGLRIAPKNMSVGNNLALSLALAGKFDEATKILKEIVANPASLIAHRQNLALVYGLAGNDAEARRIGRIDLSPEQVANNLAYYARLRDMSDHDRAREVFRTGQ